MNMTASTEKKLADELRLDRIARLLTLYPDIDTAEVAEIIRFLKKGPPLDVAMLGSREELKPALARFKGDHRHEFSLGWKGVLTVVAILAAMVAATLLLWDVGAGARN